MPKEKGEFSGQNILSKKSSPFSEMSALQVIVVSGSIFFANSTFLLLLLLLVRRVCAFGD
jgi:hypothetical protein